MRFIEMARFFEKLESDAPLDYTNWCISSSRRNALASIRAAISLAVLSHAFAFASLVIDQSNVSTLSIRFPYKIG